MIISYLKARMRLPISDQ